MILDILYADLMTITDAIDHGQTAPPARGSLAPNRTRQGAGPRRKPVAGPLAGVAAVLSDSEFVADGDGYLVGGAVRPCTT